MDMHVNIYMHKSLRTPIAPFSVIWVEKNLPNKVMQNTYLFQLLLFLMTDIWSCQKCEQHN